MNLNLDLNTKDISEWDDCEYIFGVVVREVINIINSLIINNNINNINSTVKKEEKLYLVSKLKNIMNII